MEKGAALAPLELLKLELQTHRRNLAVLSGRDTSPGPTIRCGQAASGSGPEGPASARAGRTGYQADQPGQATAKEVAAVLGDVAVAAYLTVASTACREQCGDVGADIQPHDQGIGPVLMQRPESAAVTSRDRHASVASGGNCRSVLVPQGKTTAGAKSQQAPAVSAAVGGPGPAKPYITATRQARLSFGASVVAATADGVAPSIVSSDGPTPTTPATNTHGVAAKPARQRPEWVGIRNIPRSCSISSRAGGAAGTCDSLGRTQAPPAAARSSTAPRSGSGCSAGGTAQVPRQGHKVAPAASNPVPAAARPRVRQTTPAAADSTLQQQAVHPPESGPAGAVPSVACSSTATAASCPMPPSGADFPALERTILRRQRLASLLSRTRIAPAGDAAIDAAPAASSVSSAACTGPSAIACRACAAAADVDVQGRGSGSSVAMPALLRSRLPAGKSSSADGSDFIAFARAAGGTGSVAGSGDGPCSAVGGLPSTPKSARLVAAAAASGLSSGSATEAFAALRAWRAKRAWAATVICDAARRYLDRRARFHAWLVATAATRLRMSKLSRILACWRAAARARGLLRRRYAGLALLSAEARRFAADALLVGLASGGLSWEPGTGAWLAVDSGQVLLNLRGLNPELAEILAWLCYSPGAASAAGGGRCETERVMEYGLVRGDRAWGSAVATSHRQFCREGLAEGGAYGKAMAHRRWWLLRAAWYGLALEVVAPLPE